MEVKCKINSGIGVWIEDVGSDGYVMKFTFDHLDQMSVMVNKWLEAWKPWIQAERKERRKLRDRERRQKKRKILQVQRRNCRKTQQAVGDQPQASPEQTQPTKEKTIGFAELVQQACSPISPPRTEGELPPSAPGPSSSGVPGLSGPAKPEAVVKPTRRAGEAALEDSEEHDQMISLPLDETDAGIREFLAQFDGHIAYHFEMMEIALEEQVSDEPEEVNRVGEVVERMEVLENQVEPRGIEGLLPLEEDLQLIPLEIDEEFPAQAEIDYDLRYHELQPLTNGDIFDEMWLLPAELDELAANRPESPVDQVEEAENE